MSFLIALAAFVVAIAILVVVHEYGHYSVARWCGVKVVKFSLGFGRPLYAWTSPRTGTQWTIASLPLGGYVKMLDERESPLPIAADDLPHAFNRQPVAKRIAIVAAGPIANFLLAIILFAGVYVAGVREPMAIFSQPLSGTLAKRAGVQGGERVTGIRLGRGDAASDAVTRISSWADLHWQLLDAALDHRQLVLLMTRAGQASELAVDFKAAPADIASDTDSDIVAAMGFVPGGAAPVIEKVMPGSAAAIAGLRVQDCIKAIDGQPVTDVGDFVRRIQASAARVLTLNLQRNGAPLVLQITPKAVRDASSGLEIGHIGAEMGGELPTVNVRYGPIRALAAGVQKTWEISIFSLKTFGRMLTGQASLKNLSGPVTIADYAGRTAQIGISAFVSFLALVSISLGILNLMPIPILDGGHLLYYLAEAATGKAVSESVQSILQRLGVFCILALAMIALFNDLARLFHF